MNHFSTLRWLLLYFFSHVLGIVFETFEIRNNPAHILHELFIKLLFSIVFDVFGHFDGLVFHAFTTSNQCFNFAIKFAFELTKLPNSLVAHLSSFVFKVFASFAATLWSGE